MVELLIEDVFNFSNGRIVFACKKPDSDFPKGSKFVAFIRQKNSQVGTKKFLVFPELIKLTSKSHLDLLGFATTEPMEIDIILLKTVPHFLVVQ